MRKRITEFLILVVIAAIAAFLLPNYFKENLSIVWPGISVFATWFLVLLGVLAALYFSFKPKDREYGIPNGFHKLYNAYNQITQEGLFERGKLITGSKHFYNKDGSLSHSEIYKNGLIQRKVL